MKNFLNSRVMRFTRAYKLFSLAILSSVVALAMLFAGVSHIGNYVLLAVCIVVVLPLIRSMYIDVKHGTYGVDLLAVAAIITSLLLKEYWTGIVIVLMLTGGEALEDYAEHRSKRELDALLARAPQIAHIVRGRKTVDVPAAQVHAGDRILIKAGEVVPVDASIIDGTASFDESSLTGESTPESKTVGALILSGSINLDGAITAKATQSAASSQYQQIIKLVRGAAASKAPFVRLADRYSIPFTVIAFAIAGTVWAITGDPIRFLEVIVVATPCPLLLAAPIAIISGMSRASKHGIIIRTGSALERLAAAKTYAFDKTGTLTTGKPLVSNIHVYDSFTQADVLSAAASLEAGSSHVLASAVQAAAVEQNVRISKAHHVSEYSGQGIAARISGKQIIVGRKSLLDEHNVVLPPKFKPGALKQTAMYVGIDGALAGVISFEDEIRPEASATLQRLQSLGVRHFEMVTGDNKSVATAVASKLGITQVTSEALPAEKLIAVERMPHRPVAYVGDGVNDAPVLMAADVGIALGARGSTAASESADIVIMNDSLSHVGQALTIAKRTFSIARQSILVGIGLSVLLMVVFATGRFEPIYGAAVQELVDIIVIFNALRAHSDKQI